MTCSKNTLHSRSSQNLDSTGVFSINLESHIHPKNKKKYECYIFYLLIFNFSIFEYIFLNMNVQRFSIGGEGGMYVIITKYYV